MDIRQAANRVEGALDAYTEACRRAVSSRGMESDEAATRIYHYGRGLVDAFRLVYPDSHDTGPTYAEVDRAVSVVDPEWVERHEDIQHAPFPPSPASDEEG